MSQYDKILKEMREHAKVYGKTKELLEAYKMLKESTVDVADVLKDFNPAHLEKVRKVEENFKNVGVDIEWIKFDRGEEVNGVIYPTHNVPGKGIKSVPQIRLWGKLNNLDTPELFYYYYGHIGGARTTLSLAKRIRESGYVRGVSVIIDKDAKPLKNPDWYSMVAKKISNIS